MKATRRSLNGGGRIDSARACDATDVGDNRAKRAVAVDGVNCDVNIDKAAASA